MQEFQIIDEKRYPLSTFDKLSKDYLTYWRFEHRATIGYRGRRFIVLLDNGEHYDNNFVVQPKLYIEEITSGNLERIEDDELADALGRFAVDQGFCNILIPLIKDKQNRNI